MPTDKTANTFGPSDRAFKRRIKRRQKRAALRAAKKAAKHASGFYWSDEWRALRVVVIGALGRRCLKCGRIPSKTDAHVDHVKARSRYPALALSVQNMQVLCKTCNEEKGARTADYRTDEQRRRLSEIAGLKPKPEPKFDELIPRSAPVVVRSGAVSPADPDRREIARRAGEIKRARIRVAERERQARAREEAEREASEAAELEILSAARHAFG